MMVPPCVVVYPCNAHVPPAGQSSDQRGEVLLSLHFLAMVWWKRLRQHHSWLAALAPPLDVILEVTQPQRVAVLCLSVLVNFALIAVYFGVRPGSVDQTAVAGIVGAVRTTLLWPCPFAVVAVSLCCWYLCLTPPFVPLTRCVAGCIVRVLFAMPGWSGCHASHHGAVLRPVQAVQRVQVVQQRRARAQCTGQRPRGSSQRQARPHRRRCHGQCTWRHDSNSNTKTPSEPINQSVLCPCVPSSFV